MPDSGVPNRAIHCDRDPRSTARERDGGAGAHPAAMAPRRRRHISGTHHHALAAVERLPLVVHVLHPDDDACLYVSPQLEDWLGSETGDLLGRPRPWVAHVHEDDRRRLELEWRRWRETPGESPFRARYRLHARGDATIWVDEVTHLSRGESGQPDAFAGYLLDVSEQQLLPALLDQSQGPEEPPLLDLPATLADVAPMLRRLAGEEVELGLSLPEESVWVRIERDQLELVVVNLVVNARDSMPEGGRVEIGLEAGAQAVLTITDTGAGMDPATLARVFDPFAATTDRGIGLATAQAIVTRAGGSIAVSSTLGEGSSFLVSLPSTEGESAQPEAGRDGSSEPDRMGRTVLVVDDEPALQQLERILLEDEGYSVLAASNGLDGLTVAEEHGRIDLVVTDVVLPDISGPELAAGVAALGGRVAVLYVSGYDRALLARQGVLDEGARLIEKPFRSADFLTAVRDALEGQA